MMIENGRQSPYLYIINRNLKALPCVWHAGHVKCSQHFLT